MYLELMNIRLETMFEGQRVRLLPYRSSSFICFERFVLKALLCVFFMEILQIVNSALLYSNNEKTDAYAGVSSARLEKKQRLIHESVMLCDLVLSYEKNEIWSIYNNNYFEI